VLTIGATSSHPAGSGPRAALPAAVRREEILAKLAEHGFVRVRELGSEFGVSAVTARADLGADHDVVSRFFAPGSGIDEDPVTGSAHCAIGPYWADRLGRPSLVARQAPARGGTIPVEVRGDRVELAGDAVTVLRAELLV